MLLPNLWKVPAWLIRRAEKQGNRERALKIATRYAQLRPRDPEAWFSLELLIDPDQDDVAVAAESEELFRRALEKKPGDERLELALAGSLTWLSGHTSERAEERISEVRQICTRWMKRNPRSELAEWPYLYLARLAANQGEWQEARQLLDEGSRRIVVTEGDNAFWYLIKVLLRIPQGEERARSLAEEYLRKFPGWGVLRGFLVSAMMASGQESDASEHRALLIKDWKGSVDDLDEYLRRGVDHILEARQAIARLRDPRNPQGMTATDEQH